MLTAPQQLREEVLGDVIFLLLEVAAQEVFQAELLEEGVRLVAQAAQLFLLVLVRRRCLAFPVLGPVQDDPLFDLGVGGRRRLRRR